MLFSHRAHFSFDCLSTARTARDWLNVMRSLCVIIWAQHIFLIDVAQHILLIGVAQHMFFVKIPEYFSFLVSEDASVIVLELEGDAQFWTSRNDIIGVDMNDGSTYDHEEIIDDGGDSSELVYDVPKASLTTSVPSDFEPSTVTRADGKITVIH